MKFVVDTNVPVVANGRSEQASPECISNCALRLNELMRKGKLVLDDGKRIIKEYMANLGYGGHQQTMPGDSFLKWVHTNYSNPERCELIQITPKDSNEMDFEEFPSDSSLKNFDPRDKKFIAVALAHPEKPPILQAVDTQWLVMKEPLSRAGITIDFLCEKDIKLLLRKKSK